MVRLTTPADTVGPGRGRALAVALALGLALLAAWLLLRGPARADWLEVAGEGAAVPGLAWTATVRLQPPFAGRWLSVDLHGVDGEGRGLGCVGSAPPQPVGDGTRALHFAVPLRRVPTLAAVHALAVLSQSGDWDDRTEVAISTPIAVRDQAAPAALQDLSMRELLQEAPVEDAASLRVRIVVASVWAAAALLFWLQRRGSRWALLLALGCGLLAGFELSGAGPRVLDKARELVQQHHLYDQRRLLQRIASVLAVLGSAGIAALVLRHRRGAPALAIAAICLYVAVALLGMFSLHEADRLLTARVLSLPVGKVLRLSAGLLALAAALLQRRDAAA